jgi:hypothetical protein
MLLEGVAMVRKTGRVSERVMTFSSHIHTALDVSMGPDGTVQAASPRQLPLTAGWRLP